MSRLAPLEPHALAYDKPLCASLDGFTLHAATRAGALHAAGREALLRYVVRPAVAQERVELRPDGLVRITLKEGLRRRDDRGRHGPAVLVVSASHQRAATAPAHHPLLGRCSPRRVRGGRAWCRGHPPRHPRTARGPPRPPGAPSYRPWAELLARTFAVDVLACPKCHGRMRLLAMVEEPANVVGERPGWAAPRRLVDEWTALVITYALKSWTPLLAIVGVVALVMAVLLAGLLPMAG